MRAELAGVQGRRARWRFSLGCARTATAMRVRANLTTRDRGGRGVRALALCGVVAAVGLAGYRAPALPGAARQLRHVGLGDLLRRRRTRLRRCRAHAFRGTTHQAQVARRYGLAGGLGTGAAWLLILAPAAIATNLVFVPLLVALVSPVAAAGLARRASGTAGASTGAALWSGLVGGLLVFVIWVTKTYARDGRPYDAQLLRDYHRSGSHDLVAYAVADNLGGALGLLVIIPLVALALGTLGGHIAVARPR